MRGPRLLATPEYSHLPNNRAAVIIIFSGKTHYVAKKPVDF